MTTDKQPTTRSVTVRPLMVGATRVAVVLTGLGLGMLAAPAHALPPETWPDTSEDSGLLPFLLVVGAGLAIAAVVTLAVLLPSMIRRQEAEGEGAFGEEPEWFGGPRTGLAAIEGASAQPPGDSGEAIGVAVGAAAPAKGGAGVRW